MSRKKSPGDEKEVGLEAGEEPSQHEDRMEPRQMYVWGWLVQVQREPTVFISSQLCPPWFLLIALY